MFPEVRLLEKFEELPNLNINYENYFYLRKGEIEQLIERLYRFAGLKKSICGQNVQNFAENLQKRLMLLRIKYRVDPVGGK